MSKVIPSALANIASAERRDEPYPVVIIEDALPEPFYRGLAASFPGPEQMAAALRLARRLEPRRREYKEWLARLEKSNARVNVPAHVAALMTDWSAEWRAFLDYHASPAFFAEVRRVFEKELKALYPELVEGSVGRRWRNDAVDVSLDALLAVNTPARRPGVVDRPHTDNADKVFAGLLYFADPRDEGGGDLILYRRTTPPTAKDTKWPEPSGLEPVHRVPYRANTLVLILNTPWSVHGVSARQPTPLPRRLVNFIGQARRPLF